MSEKHCHIDENTIAGGDIMDIIEPLWYSVSIYDGHEKYESDLSSFTAPQKYVHAMIWYASEVNNGGHDQFFFNSTGVVWKNALDGFREIGFDEAAEILQSAVDIMGGSPEFDRKKRQEQLDGIYGDDDDDADPFYELDDRFYDIENFDDTILKYISENKEDFYFDGYYSYGDI